MKENISISLKRRLAGLSEKQKVVLIMLLFILGVLLILFGGTKGDAPKSGTLELVGSNEYKSSLESQLESMLETVEGVGNVKVMITLEGESSRTIAYNESLSTSSNQSSSQQNTSKDAVLIRDGTSSTPYTLNENYPDVAGVLVVADGAGDSLTKTYIISAVRSTLGVSSNNITVLPMSSSSK